MKTKLLFLTLLSCFLFIHKNYAQLHEVSLKDRVENAELILEGKVTDTYPYKGDDGRIYTINKVLIRSIFKGDFQHKHVSIITLGGEFGGVKETWTHLLSLRKGETGLFFLVQTDREKPKYGEDCYEVYSSSQGFLKYNYIIENQKVNVFAPFTSYENIADFYSDFKNIYDFTAVVKEVIDWNAELKEEDKKGCIDYQLDVSDIKIENSEITVSVDISVKSDEQNLKFVQGAVIATYNTAELGSNIVQNGLITFENIGISSSSNYVVEAQDIANNKILLKVRALSNNQSLLSELTNDYTDLLRFRLTLSSFETPSILLDNIEMLENSHFIQSPSVYPTKFDCININSVFSLTCPAPVITSFTPSPPLSLSAGVGDTLTIRGMCFDTIRGASVVEFTDSKAGPSPVVWVSPLSGDYITWTDTLIRVLVPSTVLGGDVSQSAGTDRFRVKVASTSGIAVSPFDINIDYAALNFATGMFSTPASKSIPVSLSDYNGLGGQSIYYSSNFIVDTNAVNAFERALISWTCSSFVNYRIQDSISISNINRAGRIEFASLPVGVATTLASTSNGIYTPCADSGVIIGANRRNFEIKFNQNLIWHTSASMPNPLPANTYDLESTAVHELGHAHLLNHSNNPNDLMYYTNLNPPYRRTIMPNDLAGGLYIVDISSAPAPVGCQSEMIPLTSADCGNVTSLSEVEDNLIKVSLFPNPASDKISLRVNNWGDVNSNFLLLNIYDQIGRRIHSFSLDGKEIEIDLSLFSSGIYILNISDSSQVIYSSKFIKA